MAGAGQQLYVVKRDGRQEPVMFDKITSRIRKLCYGFSPVVDPSLVTQKVCQGVYKGVTTKELDELAAETAHHCLGTHPDYDLLAGRIEASNLHKQTCKSFSELCIQLREYVNPDNKQPAPLLASDVFDIVMANRQQLDSAIIYERDLHYTYLGMKTLLKSYLLRMHGVVAERPQQMIMRVALGIHKGDIPRVLQTYDMMSRGLFTHATPTLFNAGTPNPGLSSCFLLTVKEDSVDGIYDTLKDTALISKRAGGIGLSVHKIRATKSYIAGTNGTSNGLVPMLRVFNNTARYIDQCFEPSTFVYTGRGPVRMESVQTNDRVLTADGTLQKVLKVLRHPIDTAEMAVLTVQHTCEPVKVTNGHPLWCVKDPGVASDEASLLRRLERGRLRPHWVETKDVHVGDLVGFPVPTYQEDAVHFSLADCRMLGLMIASGWVGAGPGQDSGVDLAGANNPDTARFVRSYLAATLQVPTLSVDPDTRTPRLSWTEWSQCPITRSMVHDEEGQKRMPAWVLHLPLDKLEQVFFGLMEARGTVEPGSRELGLRLACREVTESVRYLLLRLGTLTSVSNMDGGLRIPRTRQVAKVLRVECAPEAGFLEHNGVLYSRVTQKSLSRYVGPAIDFEVETNHNYVTHGGLCHNGGGKRKGSFAVYLEPWHADIFEFLQLKLNHGAETDRARDLFYGLWVPDLFMQRVEADALWSLFCPHECPGLADVYDDSTQGMSAFTDLYQSYEQQERFRKQVPARTLWKAILAAQQETGTPYMLYKDACNSKSNQKHLGTIRSSNLCTEVVEYTAPDEIAVCNLASVALNRFVTPTGFDFDALAETVQVVTRNLDNVIENTMYPVPEAKYSNMRHRPIAIGVQGFADAMARMKLCWESVEGRQFNKDVFETMYHAALTASKNLAIERGPHPSFDGSPFSQGILQFDMWGVTPSSRYDWAALKEEIKTHGTRNALLLAPMPTASTAQILGNNEGMEPYSSMYGVRRVLSGEYQVVCRPLVEELFELKLWDDDMRADLVAHNGSVQNIARVPDELKARYKTSYEISGQLLLLYSAERGPYIDQSQSQNCFMVNHNAAKITSMHFYAWKLGLKTGMYYLRTKAAADAQKVTLAPSRVAAASETAEITCALDNPEECLSCQ